MQTQILVHFVSKASDVLCRQFKLQFRIFGTVHLLFFSRGSVATMVFKASTVLALRTLVNVVSTSVMASVLFNVEFSRGADQSVITSYDRSCRIASGAGGSGD